MPENGIVEINRPDNGTIKTKTAIFNSVATYSCNVRYIVVGDLRRVCTSQGWSGSVPLCGEFSMCYVVCKWVSERLL